MITDTRFFTNEAGLTLLDRFKATLKDAKYFDVLVGYFRLSGFYQLSDSFEKIDKIRIIVGLSTDRETFNAIRHNRENSIIDFESDKNAKLQYEQNVISEIESVTENNALVESGIMKFIYFLKSG